MIRKVGLSSPQFHRAGLLPYFQWARKPRVSGMSLPSMAKGVGATNLVNPEDRNI